MKKNYLLFCPLHPTSLNKMMQLAKAVNEAIPLFLLSNGYLHSQKIFIEKAGFQVQVIGSISAETENAVLQNNISRSSIFIHSLKKQLIKWPVFKQWASNREKHFIERQQKEFKSKYQKLLSQIEPIFSNYHFLSVIMCGDRHLNAELAVIQLAQKNHIPIVIPPISIFSSPNDLAKLRLKKSAKLYDISYKTDLIKIFSQNLQKLENGKYISFYPYWMLKPLSELGVLPKSPFVMGASAADVIMFSGQYEANRSESFGLKESKIRITGDSEFDSLYESTLNINEIRERLKKKYSLDFSVKTVIVALPQLFEHGVSSWKDHWQVITDICETLNTFDINVLLSLHPKMQRQNYHILEKKYAFSILDEPLSDTLPVANLFVAGQGSSTWIWASLCEVPVILCDWYGIEYVGFAHVPGVFIPKTVKSFQSDVQRLLNDDIKFQQAVVAQQEVSVKIGLFDGKASSRIISLLTKPI